KNERRGVWMPDRNACVPRDLQRRQRSLKVARAFRQRLVADGARHLGHLEERSTLGGVATEVARNDAIQIARVAAERADDIEVHIGGQAQALGKFPKLDGELIRRGLGLPDLGLCSVARQGMVLAVETPLQLPFALPASVVFIVIEFLEHDRLLLRDRGHVKALIEAGQRQELDDLFEMVGQEASRPDDSAWAGGGIAVL